MNDQALLIISIMTEKWFRKIVFIFNLSGVYCNTVNNFWFKDTVNFLNIRTPKKFVVITQKFELFGSTIQTMQTEWQTV